MQGGKHKMVIEFAVLGSGIEPEWAESVPV